MSDRDLRIANDLKALEIRMMFLTVAYEKNRKDGNSRAAEEYYLELSKTSQEALRLAKAS